MDTDDFIQQITELSLLNQENAAKITSLIIDSNVQHRSCVMAMAEELQMTRRERDELRENYDSEMKELLASTQKLSDKYERRIERMTERCDLMIKQVDILSNQVRWANEQLDKFLSKFPTIMLNSIK